ncbi:MAG: Ig-like domain-containing protein [Candidatus Syntrophopropionicum ammoniitolerans]
MFRRKSKIFGLIALAVAFTFMFSAVASAAVPVNLYFKSGDEMVKVDYAKAVSDAQDEDSTLYEAVVEKIGEAEGSGAAVVVETDEGIFLDWQKALMKSARFAEIVDDETYKTAKPEYTKELQVKDGEAIIDDPIGEIVDDALKVISVSDIDAVEVEFGASIEDVMALLPPTVTATLNNEEATEVELEINWEENGDYNGEEAGDYVFEGALVAEEDAEYTIPEEYAAVEVTVIVLEEGVVELRVVGVSAINATTVEVTFEGVEEPVTIELQEALVHGANEVVFVYEEIEYTVTVNYVDPAVEYEELLAEVEAAVVAYEELAAGDLSTQELIAAANAAAAINLEGLTEEDADAFQVRIDAAAATVAAAQGVLDEAAKAAAKAAAEAAIMELPLAADITLENKEAVDDARALVTAAEELGAAINANLLSLLVAAEAQIAELEGAITDKAAAIEAAKAAIIALPVVAEMTVENEDAVNDANAKYLAAIALGATNAEIGNTLVAILNSAEAKMIELLEAEAVAKATAAVEAAEASVLQEDVDAAQALVTALTDGDAKDELQARIDAVQAAIDAAALEAAIAEATTAVEVAEASLLQEDVDAAQVLIDALTDGDAKDELQARIDAVQAAIDAAALEAAIAEATTAVEVAEASLLQDDVDTAMALVEALEDGEAKDALVARLDAVQEAINDRVAAEEALAEATAAVVVAEESLLEADLAAAQELVDTLEASDAKTLLQARMNSVQLTINGIVTAVSNATTEVQLYNALNVKPFVNVDVAFITAYDTAITRPYTTIAEIQTIIDTVNATQANADVTALVSAATLAVTNAGGDPTGLVGGPGTATLVDTAQTEIDKLPAEIPQAVATALGVDVTVKADLQERLEAVKIVVPVLEATNQIELLAALQNPAFERVNEDLIATYENDLAVTDITIALIQTMVDNANLIAANTAVGTAETAPLTAAKVATAQALVNYLPEDVAPATTKAALQGRLDVVTALIAIADATTEAQLLAALENEDLALTNVNPAAIEDYKTLVDGGAVITTAANVQTNVITAGNAAALADAVSEIETNFAGYDATASADQAAALAELQRLADVSDDVDADTINEVLIEEYIVAIDTDLGLATPTITGTDSAKATAIQVLITAENADLDEANRLAAVNAATTAAEMRTALTAVAIAESDAYLDLTSQEKLEVAELVLVARDAIVGPPAAEFANTTAVTAAISTATTDRSIFLTAVNAATSISTMVTALDVVEFPEFQALSALEQVDVAEAVLTELEALKAEIPAAQFETIAAVKEAAGL